VGTAYHAGLEWFYLNCHRLTIPTSDELEKILVVAESALYSELPSCRVRAATDEVLAGKVIAALKAYLGYGDDIAICFWGGEYKVLGVEYPIIGEYYGMPVTGSIDLVLEEADGGVILVDHKTAGKTWDKGKHLPRKNVQAPWYVYWFMKMNPQVQRVRFCFDIMTHATAKSPPKFERRISHVMPKHEQATLDKAMAYNQLLQLPVEQLPGNTSSNLCSEVYCDFWDVCPHGGTAE
jgi:Holliday junction resolvase-like predicted endonuclease